MAIIAAADGSALGNPGPSGWAWYVDDAHWSAGGWPHGTNNQGELMAVIDLLEATAHLDDDLHIYCDSQYVINAVTKWMPGWKRKGWRKADGAPVLNRELLERLDRALQGRRFTFEWVKGHAGHELNEAADVRARAVATAYQLGDPIPIGPGWPGTAAAAATAEPAPAPEPQPDLEPALLPTRSGGTTATATDDDALEFDLFDGLPPEETDEEAVARLERELLEPGVRSDASRLAALLHPSFEEIGRSGRVWGRDALISELADEDSPAGELDVLGIDRVAPDALLLTTRTVDARGATLRSSLWVRSSGRWRLRFHQGTPEA
ncbi:MULTISPECIES: ribonuclease HI family protein [unclassified Leifsonia]|uniref:ribonuclease HI family protein n=1 Tax=unclassified Leifsonia TaxID=2663824 RepID=UPI0008A79D71|nr:MULTISPECIES: ribonuclease HI family protein [unclassified Leifsonia]SEH97799.1 ribonuclease HI [Leifsonia sp. CL154]SFL62505.1 ribonuclease HI [Leifsonia sp. CL147]